jgi:hypothetical protein
MPIKGNPQTFKGGTVLLTPITANGVIQANATAISLIIKSGSFDESVESAEAPTNTAGTLVAPGNEKVSLELSGYISQGNLTTPFANGTTWNLKKGDYVTGNITVGSMNKIGTFMITDQKHSLDPNDIVNIDLSLTNHGDLTTNNMTILAN